MSKKKGGFWSDFKAFITRGNVVDMAVGVVIGGAFGKIVTGLVNYVINPCVSLLTDGTDLDNIKTVLRKGVEATEGVEAVPEVAILWGTWIQTILDFILVAFCIFLVLRVMMHAKNRLDAKKIAAAEAACFPPAEAATEQEFVERIKYYGNHFWLLYDADKLIAFVDGFVTDEPDLTDAMYENACMHNENGAWQMIFGVNTLPEYRKRGYAGELIRRAIADARQQGRKGLVLTCKDRLLAYYAKFGFVDEGVSEKSTHGNVRWHQMRLTF